MIKNIIIIVLGYFVWLAYFDEAHSASQENQYCDIKTTIVKTVDKDGKTVTEESKEIVECDDGVSHFLQDAGMSSNLLQIASIYIPEPPTAIITLYFSKSLLIIFRTSF